MTEVTSPLLAVHQISLFNTGRLTDPQIIAAFSARQDVFQRIMEDLIGEKPRSRAQHHLLIGQRGMGKTMLLARIAAELRTGELAKRFIPLVFAEEQYAVDRLSKFWLNCLDSLADARDRAGATEEVDRIDQTVARLTSDLAGSAKDDNPFANEVLKAFLAAAEDTGLRPVLLVDNLQLVFERINEQQQHSLREVLMRPGCPIVVGASPSPPPEGQDYGAAFYEFFKSHFLRPLSTGEMRALMLHLADAAGRPEIRGRVVDHPGRLDVLRQLTGGNPRTAATLFFLYAEDFAPNVYGDLESLLDRVTPLYKARFEELSAQQQVLAGAIANHWDPVTSRELAEVTGLGLNQVSPQLDRLEKVGFIERVSLYGEARAGYQIAERFFNVWYLMRSASRRQRREVEFLTRFLQNFYESADRQRMARNLMSERDFTPDRLLFTRAVAASLEDCHAAGDLDRHAQLTALRLKAADSRCRLDEVLDLSALPPATLAFDELRRKLESLVPKDAGIEPEDFARRVLGDRQFFMQEERERLAAREGTLTREELDALLNVVEDHRNADIAKYTEEVVDWFSHRLANGQLQSAHDLGDWERTFMLADARPQAQIAVDSLPVEVGGELSDAAFTRIRELLEPSVDAAAWIWFNWGWDLQFRLKKFHEAEEAYRAAVEIDPNNAYPWGSLGNLLMVDLRRYKEAETAYRIAIEIDANDATSWNNLGILLMLHLHRHEEAEAAYRKAIAIDPNGAYPWNGLGNLYCDGLQQFDKAAEAFETALELAADNQESPLGNLLFLRRDFLGQIETSRTLLTQLTSLPRREFEDTYHLHKALFAAYDANWGIAREALAKALEFTQKGLPAYTTDDWMRASAVFIHLDYGAELLAFLEERGEDKRLRPWYEGLKAAHLGDAGYLMNIAPEVRSVAETFHEGIDRRLKALPDSTRRRPLPAAPRKSRKGARPRRRA